MPSARQVRRLKAVIRREARLDNKAVGGGSNHQRVQARAWVREHYERGDFRRGRGA